jgi:hypothetical protein
MKTDGETANALLRRALDDDGPEGMVAFNMLREKLKGVPGQIVFAVGEGITAVDHWRQRYIALKLKHTKLREDVEAMGNRLQKDAERLNNEARRIAKLPYQKSRCRRYGSPARSPNLPDRS